MAENIIDKFSYNGNTYKLQDNVSGYITSSDIPASINSVSADTGDYTADNSTQIGIYGASGIMTGIQQVGRILIGHSNSVTAQNAQAVYPIKIDAQGHISGYGTAVTIPTKTSQLTNDSNFITVSGAPVQSVNTKTGAVVLSASDVGALATTGGEVTGNVTMKGAAASNSPAIIFQRGTLTDNYNDWQIQDRGGYLYFDERGQGSSTFTNRVMFNTTGGVVATTFSGQLSGTISSGTTATTQSAGDNSTKVATTAYVDRAIPDEISDLTNDMVYDLGFIQPSSTGVFVPTDEQAEAILEMWNRGFCAVTFYDLDFKYWTFKQALTEFNGIMFNTFTGAWGSVYNGAPISGTIALGISSEKVDGVYIGMRLVKNEPDVHDIPSPSSTEPVMDGTASVGTSTNYARADHVHPTDTSRQATLVSGTNIKTINNESILGSGNITIQGGGTATDVRINGTSITSSGVANIVTNTAYNASTNKIATMNDLPILTFTPSGNNLIISQQQVSGITNGNTISY